jgi:hypothetical protein
MSTDTTVSPLRQHMIEDMAARKLGRHAQRSHIHSCSRFAAFLGRSPDRATADDVRRFHLHLIESGHRVSYRNRLMTGVRFLFRATLSTPAASPAWPGRALLAISLRHGAHLLARESQPNAIGQLVEVIGGDRYHTIANPEPPAHGDLDGLDFAVRSSRDLDHLAHVLVIGAVDRCAPQSREPLHRLPQASKDHLARLRKRATLLHQALSASPHRASMSFMQASAMRSTRLIARSRPREAR